MTDETTGTPPTPTDHETRAVVLGGGGIAGIAWESGLLTGMLEAGIALDEADLVVGTSAGAAVAVSLRAGHLTRRSDAEAGTIEGVGVARRREEAQPREQQSFDGAAFVELIGRVGRAGGDHQAVRARLGEHARGVELSLAQEAWIDRIGARLPAAWPAGRLGITAVDALDGSFHVFDEAAGVELRRAVAASCTVPTVYPLVTIDGRPYMDGGMRSATNADVAAGHDKVLVIACAPEGPRSPLGPVLDEALVTLRERGAALLVEADAASRAAFGANVLDPATSAPAYAAGLAQARDVAPSLREFWGA
ncbi:patatin-like phospholipase family protein [Agilicoccus flavus]|uniref:patatin-like phospholipase family protein n=1 Tax=Agilicoccus flavus TaxID=2775968 RepID=UPI001CF6987D|nr:patatin-like phospholipase family protein [Agilicoccus flavus]